MTQNEKRDAIVKRVLEAQLAPAQIVDLSVTEDKDVDGEPILNITVVFEAENDRLDPSQVLGLIRHLRGPLHEIGSDLFPILSFMTSEEAADAAA
ncbi:MAG: hypothetical protein F4X97_05650 [Boseongicola sp. SB0662_bin_57]|nr:hypothetical protein [Boseongicola sp. SB0662_bin_57]